MRRHLLTSIKFSEHYKKMQAPLNIFSMPFPTPKKFFRLLHQAFLALKHNDPLRMAAATAFFATFALPAILIILIQIFGWLFDPQKLSEHLFQHLASLLGTDSTTQVQQTLQGFRSLAQNWYVTIGGFIFLLFVATTLFNVLRNSLNQLWCIKVREHTGFAFRLKLRIKSAILIFITGTLFLAHLVAEALQGFLRDYINEHWSGRGSQLYTFLSQPLSVIIVTAWFTMLFKYLANGHPSWKVAATGGFFTALLFTGGKLILAALLTFSNIKTVFGASGSFVLILLFVFYTSFIIYYGGMFTKVWSSYCNEPLRLDENAYEFTFSEIKK